MVVHIVDNSQQTSNHESRKKQMRPNTQNPVGREAEQQHNVSTIAPGTEEQERNRLSELRGDDRSGSNAAQANVPDKSGSIYHTESVS
jgi:hypothetical protein